MNRGLAIVCFCKLESAMKTYRLLVMFFVLFAACQDGADRVIIPSAQTQGLKLKLEEIAVDLASDPSWLDQNALISLTKGQLSLSDISNPRLSKINSTTNSYEILIEIFDKTRNKLESLVTQGNGAYRVTIDPDEFLIPNELEELRETVDVFPDHEIPTYYHDSLSEEPLLENITIGENAIYTEPIFFVTIVKKESSLAKVSGNPSTPQSGTYLAFIGAYLKADTDDGGEEFELYLSNGPDPTNDPFLPTTDHIFNGLLPRNDASGRPRLYPNIEPTGSMQEALDTISIAMLSGNGQFRLTPIESDGFNGGVPTDGYFNRDDVNAGGTSTLSIDYYQMNLSSDQIQINQSSKYTVSQRINTNNDDRYRHAGIRNINLTNLINRMGGSGKMETDDATGSIDELADINWRLGMKIYQ